MKKATAIQRFGSVRALAAALGITTQAVYKWKESVPKERLSALKAKMAAQRTSNATA